MKDTLLNTFNPLITITISMLLMTGTLVWTNKATTKPFLAPKPSLKMNKYL